MASRLIKEKYIWIKCPHPDDDGHIWYPNYGLVTLSPSFVTFLRDNYSQDWDSEIRKRILGNKYEQKPYHTKDKLKMILDTLGKLLHWDQTHFKNLILKIEGLSQVRPGIKNLFFEQIISTERRLLNLKSDPSTSTKSSKFWQKLNYQDLNLNEKLSECKKELQIKDMVNRRLERKINELENDVGALLQLWANRGVENDEDAAGNSKMTIFCKNIQTQSKSSRKREAEACSSDDDDDTFEII